MNLDIKNIFGNLPNSDKEVFEKILRNSKFKLERIVSTGQNTQSGEWYNQENDEWVLLLSGSAGLKFEDDTLIELRQGDYLNIPAHLKHRVEWTDKKTVTIWLALHY